MEREGGEEGTMIVCMANSLPKGCLQPGVLLVNSKDDFAIKMYKLFKKNPQAIDINKNWTSQDNMKQGNVHKRLTPLCIMMH